MLHREKGFTLVLVLVMGALLGLSATLLFSMTRTDMQIAGNIHRLNLAKISAASGLNHFSALKINYNQLRERVGEQELLQVIPTTQLDDKTFYDVKVLFCCDLKDGEYLVESTGYYKKGDKIISSHPIQALFRSQ
jgi:hypothetical protein